MLQLFLGSFLYLVFKLFVFKYSIASLLFIFLISLAIEARDATKFLEWQRFNFTDIINTNIGSIVTALVIKFL